MESKIDDSKEDSEPDIHDWIALIGILVIVFIGLYIAIHLDTTTYKFDCDGDGDYDIEKEVSSTEDPIKPDMNDVEDACNFEPQGDIEAYDTDIDWRQVNSE
jgi:hypothetical protein